MQPMLDSTELKFIAGKKQTHIMIQIPHIKNYTWTKKVERKSASTAFTGSVGCLYGPFNVSLNWWYTQSARIPRRKSKQQINKTSNITSTMAVQESLQLSDSSSSSLPANAYFSGAISISITWPTNNGNKISRVANEKIRKLLIRPTCRMAFAFSKMATTFKFVLGPSTMGFATAAGLRLKDCPN